VSARRSDPHRALLKALTNVLAPAKVTLECGVATHWASVTFAGVRHEMTLLVMGEDARDATHALTHSLSETEFDLPDHIVADIHVVNMTYVRIRNRAAVRLTIEALTVEMD
jgi:hypothetical protein